MCPPLPAITNGIISYSPDVPPDYDLGTEATYTCEAGFYLEGNEVRVCMDDDGMDAIGVWSGQEPSCVRKFRNCIISPVAPPPVRPVLFQLRLTNINNCPDWVVSAKNVLKLKQTNNYLSLYTGPGWEVRNCNECVCCRGGESLWVWFLKHGHDCPSLPLLPWVGQSCHIPSHSNRFQAPHSHTSLDTDSFPFRIY